MSKIESKTVEIEAPARVVFGRLSNPGNLKAFLDSVPREQIPADRREMIEKIEADDNTLSLPGGPSGHMRLGVDEVIEPSLVRLRVLDLPLPLTVALHLDEAGESLTRARCEIEADLPAPMMLMAKGMLQKSADAMATMIASIPYA